jgi:hypothetical protein
MPRRSSIHRGICDQSPKRGHHVKAILAKNQSKSGEKATKLERFVARRINEGTGSIPDALLEI